MKRINNLHLSVMILIVSILSIALVQRYVFAQWTDPNTLPGGTPSNNIVVNPMIQDLNLNGKKLMGANITVDPSGTKVIDIKNNGELCFNSTDCASSWAGSSLWQKNGADIYYTDGKVGIGIADPVQPLHIQDTNGQLKFTGNQIYHYNSPINGDDPLLLRSVGDIQLQAGTNINVWLKASGKLGLGTSDPNPTAAGKVLHIYDSTNNAELDLQSGGSDGDHWALYHDGVTDSLKFWKSGYDRVTIKNNGEVGIGVTNPVYSLEVNRNSADLYAAKFSGGLTLTDGSLNSYLQLNHILNAPSAADCSSNANYKGRMVFQYSSSGNGRLWICNYTGWEYIDLLTP